MKRALAVLVCLSAASAAAADEQARLLLAGCTGCHAPASQSAGSPPQVFGRPHGQIAELLLRFKRGELEATVMDRIARGFTDDELAALAEALERHSIR